MKIKCSYNNHVFQIKKYAYSFLLVFSLSFLFANGQNVSPQLSDHIDKEIKEIDIRIDNQDYKSALSKIENVESYKNFISNKRNKLIVDLKKARVYHGLKEEKKAMDLLLNGLDELESSNSLTNIKIDYIKYLGEIFWDTKNYGRSLNYFDKSLKYSLERKDTANILFSYLFIGKILNAQGKTDTINYFKKIIDDYEVNSKTADIIAKAYNSLVADAAEIEDYDLAVEYATKSLNIRQSQNDTVGVAYALINLSGVQYVMEDYSKAKENYQKAYNLVKDRESNVALKAKEYSLYNLAFSNEMLGDYKEAYQFLEKATNLTDSISNAKVTQNISEIEAKYNFEKQARVAEEEKRKRSQAQALFYGTALVFLTLLALGYIFYRNYRLKQQNKLEQIENQTQTKIINATIDAKEKERKAIAETLHDSVSALLSSANLHLQATKAQLKKEAPHEVTKAQTIVNEASVKIRDLSHELISSVLLKFGLAFAVHDMCQKYSNSEINIHSDDDGIKRYHQDFEIKIHNIIEELINNILKHSKASNATIMLAHKENDMLSVRISDDGVGFNPKSVRGKDGLGLSHIEARIKVMNGVFNIVSSKNNGTNIFILVPIQFKTKAVPA